MMSSICSVPIERRMVLGLMPWSSSSSAESWLWVVVAGWITRDFTSATFASREKIETDPSKPVSLITIKGLGYKLIARK